MGQKLDAVIEMQVDDDALVDRITGRPPAATAARSTTTAPSRSKADGKCDVCGGDRPSSAAPMTTKKACKRRLMAYYKQTSPLIGYYYAKGSSATVDGLAEIGRCRHGNRPRFLTRRESG